MRAALEAARGGDAGDLARLYHANKLFAHARRSYEKASESDPDEGEWPYLLGAMELNRGHPREAAVALETATRRSPDYLPAWIRLGRAHLDIGNIDAARRAFEEATRLAPGSPWPLLGLGRVARTEDNPARAIEHLQRAIQIEPQLRTAHYLLAQIYREVGDTERSTRSLSAFRDSGADPELQDPWLRAVEQRELGDQSILKEAAAALVAGDLSGAERRYVDVLTRHPEDYGALLNLGIVYFAQRRLDAAERQFRRTIDLRADDPHGHHALARCLLATSRVDEARTHLREVVRLDPGNREAADLLSQIGSSTP